MLKVTVLYVGSSVLAPLRQAEREINERHQLDLSVATRNCTLPLDDSQWQAAEADIAESDLVFVIHVTDNENAVRIAAALDRFCHRHHAVIVINCLGDLMRRTRLHQRALFAGRSASGPGPDSKNASSSASRVMRKLGSWMAGYVALRRRKGGMPRPEQYLKFAVRIPAILRLIPSAGTLGGIKHYLTLFCYFLQPTPANIGSMLLYAIKHCVPGHDIRIRISPPESRPVLGIYHPDSPRLFESVDEYRAWYEQRPLGSEGVGAQWRLDPQQTIGLLLMRPQIVSGAHRHYDGLIRALEGEGLPVLPVLSTLMDNREACRKYFSNSHNGGAHVGQILSLTGFSFVGGPAMNDSEAAVAFLQTLNCPLRSAVNLETQSIENWTTSMIGLNPVQTAMQVAIPEIDGATEPFIFGGLPAGDDQPMFLEDRCRRIARRMSRWNRLRLSSRKDVRLAFLIYCFPPNKGNLGTAADLDVFPSLWHILRQLEADSYSIEAPQSPEVLRELLLGGDGQFLSIAHRLSAEEYFRHCPFVEDIEAEWGPSPGQINTSESDILIHGIQLGQVFVGVQPTFGYEGDPMRLLMAQGGAPHHGFMGLYTYLDKIFRADAVIHVGTHGALEFMPGKQVGLSSRCWPDRLIGEFPNVYIYSVNNPSEGSIAKRRSYAELISYLTPPIENAGLYKELASLKELIGAYRQTRNEGERERLFAAIEEKAACLKLNANSNGQRTF